MDWKINLLLLLMILFIYKLYSLNKETFVNNNISINHNIENTYGLDKRCDLENPQKVIPNQLLVKSHTLQLYKNPKYDIKNNHGFKDTVFLTNSIQVKKDHKNSNIIKFYKNNCLKPCMNKCFKNCMNKYIDLDREILKVPLYLYPELYYHPLDEPN
jgi:hypothetical protein